MFAITAIYKLSMFFSCLHASFDQSQQLIQCNGLPNALIFSFGMGLLPNIPRSYFSICYYTAGRHNTWQQTLLTCPMNFLVFIFTLLFSFNLVLHGAFEYSMSMFFVFLFVGLIVILFCYIRLITYLNATLQISFMEYFVFVCTYVTNAYIQLYLS